MKLSFPAALGFPGWVQELPEQVYRSGTAQKRRLHGFVGVGSIPHQPVEPCARVLVKSAQRQESIAPYKDAEPLLKALQPPFPRLKLFLFVFAAGSPAWEGTTLKEKERCPPSWHFF